jgi:hypothetical protein
MTCPRIRDCFKNVIGFIHAQNFIAITIFFQTADGIPRRCGGSPLRIYRVGCNERDEWPGGRI